MDRWSRLDLNRTVSYSLRVGVVVAAILSLVGMLGWAGASFQNVDPANASNIASVLGSAVSGNIAGIIYLGIVVLIATPVFRVAISVIYFGLEKDRKYVGITLIVLAMLVFALLSQATV